CTPSGSRWCRRGGGLGGGGLRALDRPALTGRGVCVCHPWGRVVSSSRGGLRCGAPARTIPRSSASAIRRQNAAFLSSFNVPPAPYQVARHSRRATLGGRSADLHVSL